MKAFRGLVYFLILVTIVGGYAMGAYWFYTWDKNPILAGDRLYVLIIPSLGILAFAVGWTERFLLRSGALMGLIGGIVLLFHDVSPIGKSLQNLSVWHKFRNQPPQAAGQTPDPSLEPAGSREYIGSLTESERADFMGKNPFSQWMVADIVKKYENNVNGFAYLGAGILIFLIGLRGLGIITREGYLPIVISLEIEFTVIATLGLLLFYKPEESSKVSVDIREAMPRQELKDLAKVANEIREEMAGDRTVTLEIRRKKG